MIVCAEPDFKMEKLTWELGERRAFSKTIFIKDYEHFMNTVRYVSNRSSICHDKSYGRKNWRGECHFYIHKKIIPHSLESMALLHDAGVSMMSNILHGKKNVAEILLTQGEALIEELRQANCSSVAIGHLNKLRGHVFPITGDMQLSVNFTDYRLALSNNRYRFYDKMHEKISASRDIVRFNEHQIQNGNVMLDMVVDVLHTFTKHQKQTLEVGLAIHDRLTQHLIVKDDIIAEKDTIISAKDKIITEKDSYIVQIIAEKDQIVTEKDKQLAEKDQIIYQLAMEKPMLLSNKKRKAK
jgi:hypothetical protein